MAGDEAVIGRVDSIDESALGSEKSEGITVGTDGVVVDHGLHRALKRRHLQMIALGGVIGYVPLSKVSTLQVSWFTTHTDTRLQREYLVRHRSSTIVFWPGKKYKGSYDEY